MSVLANLIIGHMAGDFLFQTKWMAENKSHNFAALLLHSCIYTTAVACAALLGGGITPLGIVIVLLSHIAVDNRKAVEWWCRHITKSSETPWLVIAADQSFHLIVLLTGNRLRDRT